MGSLFSNPSVHEQSNKRIFSDSLSDSFINQVFEDDVFEDDVFEDVVFEDEVFEDEVFKDKVFNVETQIPILDYINSLIFSFNIKKINQLTPKRLFSITSTDDYNI